MCGIVYVRQRNGKPALKKVRKAYQAQKHRGTNGYGFVEIDKGYVGELKRAQFEQEIFPLLSASRATEILFHHRIPTSTPNTCNTAHPIPVSNDILKYDYYGVHNGMISNDSMLKEKQEKLGFRYTTELRSGMQGADGLFYRDNTIKARFNDSEALIIDLALAIENEKEAISAFGSIAFIMLQVDKKTRKAIRLFWGRNNRNPLKIDLTETYFKLSSEGSGEEVKAHTLHCMDYATGEITERPLEVGSTYDNQGSYWDKSSGRSSTVTTTEGGVKTTTTTHGGSKESMGFHTHPPQLPAVLDKRPKIVWPAREQAEIDGLLEEGDEVSPYQIYDLIPCYGASGVDVVLSDGRRTFYFMQDLQESYEDLEQEINNYRDEVADELLSGTMTEDKRDEYNTYYSILKSDLDKYVTVFNAIEEYEAGMVREPEKEPIL